MSAPADRVRNVFTVDVEHWCHASTEEFSSLPPEEQRAGVLRGLDRILELLSRHGRRATFFLVGPVAEAIPDVVRRLASEGHEIGSHGYEHRRIDGMTPEEFEADLIRSRQLLRSITNEEVRAYRSPMWSLYGARRWAFEILSRQGIRVDSSLFPIPIAGHPELPRTPYDLSTPVSPVRELPPLVGRGLFMDYPMGGTWGLRLFSYSDIQRAIRRANGSGSPAVLHLHPWELDPQRPPLRQPFWTRLALTVRFTDLYRRIDRLLREFEFAPLSEVASGLQCPPVSLESLP